MIYANDKRFYASYARGIIFPHLYMYIYRTGRLCNAYNPSYIPLDFIPARLYLHRVKYYNMGDGDEIVSAVGLY